MQQAKRFDITSAEMQSAETDAKDILRTEAEAAGPKSLSDICQALAVDDRLLELDKLQLQITGNSH